MLYNHPTLFFPDSKRGKPMASSMLLAKRVAWSLSSCDVASVLRRYEEPMVWGLSDHFVVLDARRLLPYLLGFRTGMATDGDECSAAWITVKCPGYERYAQNVCSRVMLCR